MFLYFTNNRKVVVTNCLVYELNRNADSINGKVYHYKDATGLQCDAVVHLRNGSYGLIEIKLGGDKLIESGATNLIKLQNKIDTEKNEKTIIFNGFNCYF